MSPPRLSLRQALALRMRSLLLDTVSAGRPPSDVTGVVTWFGAMQAQSLASGLWSLGARLPGHTVIDVLAALERAEAVRTWPMRGTLHWVPGRDARWMVQLMAPRIATAAATRRAALGIDDATAHRAVELLAAALTGGGRLTRSQCLATLTGAGIAVDGQRGVHLLGFAAAQAVICVAPDLAGQTSFVLLDEWVPDPRRPDREEALAIMAMRYFRSHGPTTKADFAGWTGLTLADAGRAIALAGDRLVQVQVADDARSSWLDPQLLADSGPEVGSRPGAGADDGAREALLALPGFDEYLLGYKDRSMMLDAAGLDLVVRGGVFQSTLVRRGRVIGAWKRTTGRAETVVEVFPLEPVTARLRAHADAALQPYARFIQHPIRVRWA